MTEEEMKAFAAYLDAHREELAHQAHVEKRSRKQLVIRIGGFVIVVTVVSCAGLWLHYEVLYKGAEFVVSSITDRILTQLME